MQCLFKYKWVKLPRSHRPEGTGIMGFWAKLAARAAFRRGVASYCGHSNPVTPGMWSGGVVGLKSILGIRNREKAFEALERLSALGYVQYEFDAASKRLSYQINDWVMECSGSECMDGAVYATDGYGFLCVPRNITDRLIENNCIFEEADAWLDLWCHTVFQDQRNAFSFLAPTCQYGKYDALLTLETLGQRWHWEKTKVWRFMQKHKDVFSLYRLPGSYGCLIFNRMYPADTEVSLPCREDIMRILDEIRIYARNAHKHGSDREYMSRMIAWYSRRYLLHHGLLIESKNGVSFSYTIYRAYISLCENRKHCKYDCGSVRYRTTAIINPNLIRGPCESVDLNTVAGELFSYENP